VLGQLSRGTSSLGREPEVKGVYARVAEKLELDEDTVRKRVDRLESAGIIRGWQLLVNPNVLGLKIYAVRMTVNPQLRMEEAVRKIKLVHGIISIVRDLVDVLTVGLFCESEEVFRSKVELISELTGTKELTTYVVSYPEAEVEPTYTDWRIIDAFRPDPLLRYTRAAEKLGLSSRTVHRRLRKLTRGNVIFFRPNIDFSLFEGSSCVDLFVSYTSSGFKHEVDRSIFAKYEDCILRAGWGSASHGYFEFVITNVHVAQEIVDWTRSLRGIREVKLNFKHDRLNFYEEALDEVMASKFNHPPALRTP
jgi:DNA-binding Lrp family transcriptional regulator